MCAKSSDVSHYQRNLLSSVNNLCVLNSEHMMTCHRSSAIVTPYMVIRNKELEMCGEMGSTFLLHVNRHDLMMAVKSKRVAF